MMSGRGVVVLVLALMWNNVGTVGTLNGQAPPSGQPAPPAKAAPAAQTPPAQTAPPPQPAPPGPGAPAAAGKAACSPDLVKSLAGTWKAPQYKMKRGSDVGAQIFGPNSFDLRDVDLTLDASGSGLLKITTSVLDEKGKTWAPTLVEADIAVGAAPPSGTNCEPAVTVTRAEEQYLGELEYEAPLDGARVVIIANPSAKQIELRFETPRGEGSFWTTLRRQAGR
jgi:hypothetical protein